MTVDFEPQVFLENLRNPITDAAYTVEDDLKNTICHSFHQDHAILTQGLGLHVPLESDWILLAVAFIALLYFVDDGAILGDVLIDVDAVLWLMSIDDFDDVVGDVLEIFFGLSDIFHELVEITLELFLVLLALPPQHYSLLCLIINILTIIKNNIWFPYKCDPYYNY